MNPVRRKPRSCQSIRSYSYVVVVLTASAVIAQPTPSSFELRQLLDTAELVDSDITVDDMTTRRSRYGVTIDGHLRFISAAPLHHFLVANALPHSPLEVAAVFVEDQAKLLGVSSPAVKFVVERVNENHRRTHVRLQQTYRDIPVFGAQVSVQVNPRGGVEFVLSDIARDLHILDQKSDSITPVLSAEEVVDIATALLERESPGRAIETSAPQLMLFSPSVVGAKGPMRLVWSLRVWGRTNLRVAAHLLLDANLGGVVRRYPLNKNVMNREVFDSNNSDADPGTRARVEGDSATGNADVDDAYDFLGDSYDFYSAFHGREGVDDPDVGSGMIVSATVRYCDPDPRQACPFPNAFWSGGRQRFYFGEGWAVDDIVGHEYTHGVTDFESNLVYENHSGAINESLSDVWGEFIDLTNGAGTDTPDVRWLIGEDLNRVLRDMSHPPAYDDPDRMGHSHFIQPVDTPTLANDFGGVHTNSGVNNKVCFLLTDGATFRDWQVPAMGIDRVARLYYEAATNLLTAGADYDDLYVVLERAARNLGAIPWYAVYKAGVSVEIADTAGNVHVDVNHFGIETGSDLFPYDTIEEGHDAAGSGGRLIISQGSYSELVRLTNAVVLIPKNGTVTLGR